MCPENHPTSLNNCEPKAVMVSRLSTKMISDELTFNLFKLFAAVRDKGGYGVVSRSDLWDLVAKESGLGPITSSTLRLLYIEFLSILESGLEKVVDDRDSSNRCCRNGDGTGFGFNGLSSDIQNLKKNNVLPEDTKLMHELKFSDCDDTTVVLKIDRDKNIDVCGETFCHLNKEVDIQDIYDLHEGEDPRPELASNVDENSVDIEEGVETNVEFSNSGRKCVGYDPDNKEGVTSDFTSVEEQNFSHKRNCESMLGMVNWITEIAKHPCDPNIGLLPERSKWNTCGNEEVWKQVLLIRVAMLQKRHINFDGQSSPQKIQPCKFDDHQGSSYNLRERVKSRKVLPSGMSCIRSLILGMEDQLEQEKLITTDSWMPDYMGKSASKRIPVGPKFQVEVPEWSGITSESDTKWLGTLVWPLDKVNHAFLIEHNVIGKGRQDLCECHVRGSTQCTRYHILMKRYQVKWEIGSAFYAWKFDRMGEGARLGWTEKEEHKFKNAARSSSGSLKESFWTRIFKIFPSKIREDLVCYYFNVHLLQRRGFQNRFTPDKICSDDELEFK